MISDKKHIQQLASILLEKGLKHVIISPGSRNGPLINTFVGSGQFICKNIVDERSAGYFAIGLAQQSKQAVALVCSSGTASLNYAPAVAEAFYQKIPLLVLTADRPPYWINQGESQCIVQNRIYRDFVRYEATLPLEETPEKLDLARKQIEQGIDIALGCESGPVHLNIPLEEPLHQLESAELNPSNQGISGPKPIQITDEELGALSEKFNRAKKVMVLVGQLNGNTEVEDQLIQFAHHTQAVVLKEHLSNIHHPKMVGNIDLCLSAINGRNAEQYRPDLLISLGGQLVSKSIKTYLRQNKPTEHWHISISGDSPDTYRALTETVQCNELSFFKMMEAHVSRRDDKFLIDWLYLSQSLKATQADYLEQIDFSDLWVFNKLRSHIPQNSFIHLGNSMTVRYGLLCEPVRDSMYLGNRGTSGIDGSLSTAIGFASSSSGINTVILGDLSFLYDSNALWNNYLNNNLRIVVLNNGGGNIFGIIKGPSESPAFKEHFYTQQKYSAKGLAATFNLNYYKSESKEELEKILTQFFDGKEKASLLEVFTDGENNTRVFHELFKLAKQV